jgi:hypothetical protein
VAATLGKRGGAVPPFAAHLEPTGSRWPPAEPHVIVQIGNPDEDWPPPDGEHVTATVTYSDVRKVGRYQQSMSVDPVPGGRRRGSHQNEARAACPCADDRDVKGARQSLRAACRS